MATNNADWIKPLNEPVRVKRPLPAGATQYLAYSHSKPIVSFSYHRPFHEPVWIKRGLSAVHQQPSAFVKAAPFPEGVSLDRWLPPLSTPFNRSPALVTAQQAQPTFVRLVELLGAAHWLQPLAEPNRIKRPPPDNLSFVAITTSAEVITADKWFRLLDSPSRHTGIPAVYEQVAPLPLLPSLGWQRPLAEPLGLTRSRLYALSFVPFIDAPAPLVGSWNLEWTLPVRFLVSHKLFEAQRSQTAPFIQLLTYTVSGLYVIDLFTGGPITVGGVSKRTN